MASLQSTAPLTSAAAPRAWFEVYPGRIPSWPGAYVVYFNGEIVYVGSSTDLQKRVRLYFRRTRPNLNLADPLHRRPRFQTPWGQEHDGAAVRVKVKLSRRNGDWLMREWRLISRLRPMFNTAGVPK